MCAFNSYARQEQLVNYAPVLHVSHVLVNVVPPLIGSSPLYGKTIVFYGVGLN